MTSPARPDVSVVIPAYGHAAYIREAIDSALAQRGEEGGEGGVTLEVIVVNDGSPDHTAEVLRPLVDAGTIQYVEQPNAGQATARNRGIALARGEFIALLDDDDRWPTGEGGGGGGGGKLAWQVEAMRREPEAVLVYGDWAMMNAEGRLSDYRTKNFPSGNVSDLLLEGCAILSPGQTLIRRTALDAVGGFAADIWGSDDWDLYLRLSKLGPFIYEPRIALHYRQHAGNASGRAIQHTRNHLTVLRRHAGLRPTIWRRNLKSSASFFVPKLLHQAHALRRDRHFGQALRAQGYALLFQPSLAMSRSFLAGLLGSILRRPPRE